MESPIIDLDRARAQRRGTSVAPWTRKRELAQHLGVSQRTIERWMKKGLPHRKFGCVLFQIPLCEAWLEEQDRARAR